MRQTRPSPFARLPAAAVGLAALVLLPRADAQPPRTDAVEAVRLALKAPVQDVAARARQLQQATGRLTTIPDLRRALTLQEWRDEDPDGSIAAVDLAARTAVTQRFVNSVRDVLHHGDALRRLAATNLLTELGTKARNVGSRQSVARAFGNDLAQLLKNEDARVRESAARALGQIAADPELVAAALGGLLGSKEASD